MPNTPVIVLHGVTIYSLGENISEEDRETVNELLTSVGVGMEMQEYYMDIMTGLTGGGPSFVSLTMKFLGYYTDLYYSPSSWDSYAVH